MYNDLFETRSASNPVSMIFRRFNSKSTDALTNRFTELILEQLSKDPNLMSKLNESEAAKFKSQFDSQLHYLKLEKLLKYNKHGREISTSKPWTGAESAKDASLRMLVDSAPQTKAFCTVKDP